MGDLTSTTPLTGGVALLRNTAAPLPPAVPTIEKGSDSRGLSGRMASDAGPQTAPHPRKALDSADRQARQDQPKKPDPKALTGPSPAFQASVLELELDLQIAIARTQAARSRQESDIAMRPGPTAANTEFGPKSDTASVGVNAARAVPVTKMPQDAAQPLGPDDAARATGADKDAPQPGTPGTDITVATNPLDRVR